MHNLKFLENLCSKDVCRLFFAIDPSAETHFHQNWISLSLNAKVDDSMKSLAHLPIVKRLACQFWGVCTGCYFIGMCTSAIW